MEQLAARYAPEGAPERRAQAIDREWKALCMLEMTIDHLSGKAAIELVKERCAP